MDTESSISCHERSSHHDKDLPGIPSDNDRFWGALDYRMYRLADKLSWYDEEAVRSEDKWAKRLQVQVKWRVLDFFDPISIVSFLSSFKLACATDSVHEGAAVQFLSFFVKHPAAAALNTQRCKSHRHHGEGTVYLHSEADNYLLKKCATDDVIVETDGNKMRFMKLSNG